MMEWGREIHYKRRQGIKEVVVVVVVVVGLAIWAGRRKNALHTLTYASSALTNLIAFILFTNKCL